MKVLIAYETEGTRFFKIDMAEEEYTKFSQVHDSFINSEEASEEQEAIMMQIEIATLALDRESDKKYYPEELHHYFGIWADKEVTDNNIEGVEKLIYCGFLP